MNKLIIKKLIKLRLCQNSFKNSFKIPSQDSPVWLELTSREQLMSPECSKHHVLSFAKMLVVWWTNRNHSVLISVLQSAEWINSERIYPRTRVSSFPGLKLCKHYLVTSYLLELFLGKFHYSKKFEICIQIWSNLTIDQISRKLAEEM